MSAEAEAIGECGIDGHISSALCAVVQVALRVGNLIAACNVNVVILYRKSCSDCFNCASRTEEVTCHRLCGVDNNLSCSLFTEGKLDCLCFILVVKTCGSTVCVDIVEILSFSAFSSLLPASAPAMT